MLLTRDLQPVGRFAVAADHPSLPGHFPGRPVVPGVVLLDHVLALVGRGTPAACRVKFTSVVRPDEPIDVLAGPAHAGWVDFVGRHGDRVVLHGRASAAP